MADRDDAPDSQERNDPDQRDDERVVEEAEPEGGQALSELEADPAEAEQGGRQEETGPTAAAHGELTEPGQQIGEQRRREGRLQAPDTP